MGSRMLREVVARAGKWTVQQAAELSVPAPTIEAALDGRFLSGLKDQRVAAAKTFSDLGLKQPTKHEVCPAPAVSAPTSAVLVCVQGLSLHLCTD